MLKDLGLHNHTNVDIILALVFVIGLFLSLFFVTAIAIMIHNVLHILSLLHIIH